MVKGAHVPARITHPIVVREFEQLEDYQLSVGGMIEAVDIQLLRITVYVNEEGLLRGLEFNPRATFLWWYHVPEARQKAMLVGDAVIVGWPDAEGNSTDLPDDLLAIFTQPGDFWLEAQWQLGDEWARVETPMPYGDYFDALVWALILVEKGKPHELKVVSRVMAVEDPDGGGKTI
jgi:hypothetical protein